MRTIGAYEAKTHLPRLLDEVAAGEEIIITKHGVPVAVLIPARPGAASIEDAIRSLRAFRARHPLGDVTFRELIDEGRR